MALRDESPYRGGCRLGPGTHGGGHRRQRSRRDADGEAAARRGGRHIRRCRLYRSGQAARTGGPRGVVEHRDQARHHQGFADSAAGAGGTGRANAVRLQLHALAYNLGNFMRTLAMPKTVEKWSMTSLREKLIKIGAKIVSHGRYVIFQLAEVAVPRRLFAEILSLIARLRAPTAPA